VIEGISQAEARRSSESPRIDFIDSSGLGTMVMCQTRLQKINGVAKLAYLNRRNLELLLLTKIDTIFEVFDDETEAVNSFFPEREIRRFDILAFVQQLKDEDSAAEAEPTLRRQIARSSARFSNLVCACRNTRSILRSGHCAAWQESIPPVPSDLRGRAGRPRTEDESTTSASCSMEPDSRRSLNAGGDRLARFRRAA